MPGSGALRLRDLGNEELGMYRPSPAFTDRLPRARTSQAIRLRTNEAQEDYGIAR
jgi:hypothetical protein